MVMFLNTLIFVVESPNDFFNGHLSFLIYINHLSNVSKPLSFYLFTDDTNIYFEASDLFTFQKVMNRELSKIKKIAQCK